MQVSRQGGLEEAVAWKEIASSGGSRRVWRRSEGLEQVEGSGSSTGRSSGGDRRLWRRSESLEAVRGSGGGQRLRRQSAPSSGDGKKLWRQQEALEVEEALEEVEDSGGSKHEALEAVEASG
jgi:hypothetical protein